MLEKIALYRDRVLRKAQGLVANGAKVYITALPEDDMAGAVTELNDLGSGSGGKAFGSVYQSGEETRVDI